MDKLTCIIHYDKGKSCCSKIKAISEVNREKIYAAKLLREKLVEQIIMRNSAVQFQILLTPKNMALISSLVTRTSYVF